MPLSAKWYLTGLQKTQAGLIVWGTDQIDVSLHSSAFSFNQTGHEFFSSVSSSELATSGGYTAGGATLASKTNNKTDGTLTSWLDAADVSWTASGAGFTCRYAVVRKNTGSAATSPLLGYYDLGADQALTTAGWILTLQFDAATGVCAIVAA